MPTYAAMGCFPGATAIKSVSQADLNRLTYGTSYKTGVPGKVMREDDKWENMIDIHDVGKKDTKYMKYQRMKAPLLDRSACSTRRDFVELPLGDNIINAELAENFKGGLKGGPAGLAVSAKNDSCYKGEFVDFGAERTRTARPKSCKPRQTRTATITGMKDLLETKASSHLAHTTPEASLAKAAEMVLLKPNLGLAGNWQGPPPKSAYKASYNGMKPSHSAPQIGMLGGMEDDRPSVLLPDNHPSFHMRRMCYMSPGM